MFKAGASLHVVSHCVHCEVDGGIEMNNSLIKEHMEVIGADSVHIGTVDRVENGKIKLTRLDSGEGSHKGHHHLIDLGLVAEVEGQKVRLSANAAVAVTMEEEEPRKQS
jgi:hypothetical protein